MPATILIFGSMAMASPALHPQSAPPAKRAAATPDHLQKGRELGAQGLWPDAERELRIYRNAHPDSSDAVLLHAEALLQLSQPFDAALELQQFLRKHPDSVRALLLHSSIAANTLKDLPLAESELESCLKLAPQDSGAWKSLGFVLLQRDKNADAVEAYLRAAHLKPTDPIIAAALAYAYGQAGLTEKAEAQFHYALKLTADSPHRSSGIQLVYGQYLVDQDRGQEAVAALNKTLEYAPNSAEALYWRARAYQSLKDIPRAKADALESFRLSPRNNETAVLLVNLYRKEGDLAKAQEYAGIAQSINDDREAHLSLGRSLRGNLDQAEHLLHGGNFAEAIPHYESIISQLPSFYEAYFDLGMCYGQTGRPQDAEAAFRKYLTFQPVSADGHAALGVLLLSEGQNKDALPELEQAIQIDPGQIEARKVLAREYLQESNPKAAIATLHPAEKDADAELLVLLATAFDLNGDHALALAKLKRALAIQPDNSDALQLQQRILGKAK